MILETDNFNARLHNNELRARMNVTCLATNKLQSFPL